MFFTLTPKADHSAVANDGLGKDIWTVPFDKITYILHVSQRQNLLS
jgi:hypothetical protein